MLSPRAFRVAAQLTALSLLTRIRYPFNFLFNFSPLTDISLLDHAKTESITNYNTNSKLGAGVSRKGPKVKRLFQTNSKQGAVVSSKDEKALRV
ncbi:uncharacterized protein METZ01_LOCUS489614 [marine metagenome]|uniref:Uncharacterized protein n=1 Tax=marine metagenome TaxID=408172 RepID=A0A383CXI4_9ZZZZ